MFKVKCFVCNTLQENCYVVSDETGECVIIDCGAYFDDERQAIVSYIRGNGLKPQHLLCTHGHFDHCFGNDTIWREFGLKPEVAAEDEWLMDISTQMRDMMGVDYNREVPPYTFLPEAPSSSTNAAAKSDSKLKVQSSISFGSHQLSILHTPGHTPGGVCFYCAEERVVFTGDTLFRMSVGRTDFDRGSWNVLIKSLHTVIALLPADTTVYTGHGPQTTVGDELRYNPYLR